MDQLAAPGSLKAYVEKCETAARQGVPIDWRQVAINVAASAEDKIAELDGYIEQQYEAANPSRTEPDNPPQS